MPLKTLKKEKKILRIHKTEENTTADLRIEHQT